MKQIIIKISLFNLFLISLSVQSQPIWDPLSATLKNDFSIINNNTIKTTGWQAIGPSTNDILDFAFNYVDPNIIYAASRDSGVFKTINGGISWIQINNGINDNFIRSIGVHPTNSNIILAGSFNNGLFRSSNAGNTWNHVVDINDGTILDISFNEYYPDTVFVATHNSGIYRSSDAGISWQNLSIGNSFKVIIDPIVPSRVYYLSYSTIFKSENYGNTWSTFFTANNEICSCEINPQNNNIIFLGTNPADSLYKTIDMGAHWQRLPFSDIITDILVNSADTSQIYLSGPAIGVYRSTNSGFSWIDFNNNLITLMVIELKQHHLDTSTLYASMNEGSIKKNNEIITSNINDFNGDKLRDCILSQNSPNPFELSTTIFFEIFTPQVISLKVYNIFGLEVASSINDYKYPGKYEIKFDSGDLPCGNYLYSIITPNFISTKRMIIIK